MKTIRRVFQTLALITALAVLLCSVTHAQNAIQFTAARATVENAILLYWASNTNEVYEIDYADQLAGNPDGTTAWQTLYTDYGSHGTNTFIADAGNYDNDPAIPHPKNSPMRFYRLVSTGTNTSPSNPTISINSLTDGATVSGEIVVSVSTASSEYVTEVNLYVDGEPQWITGGGSFVINTCEWPNGPHTIFATAKAQSSLEAPSYNDSITIGRCVSSYVNVAFDNLISRLDVSQYFFEPSDGQTQQVTATFAAGVDWTLQIQDASSNTVRTATGSGVSMSFNWDGMGDGATAIPDGPYTYLLSAQTNGQLYLIQSGGNIDTNPPPAPSFGVSVTPGNAVEVFALPPNGGSIVPLELYPPGYDTNGFTFFEATWPDVLAINTPASQRMDTSESGGMSSDYSGPSSQVTRGPKRRPRVGVKNKSGTFGICYQTCPAGFSMQQPRTRNPLQPFTGVDGGARSSAYVPWNSMTGNKAGASAFAQVMQAGSYKQKFLLGDGQWGINDIRSLALGGNSIFRTCNFGILETHGCYGTYPEIDGIYYTYLALFDEVHGAAYLRLSDMAFGSPGAGGAKWMTILSCNMLNGNAITSMATHSKSPANGNLHLLLGFNSYAYSDPYLELHYASNLVFEVTIRQSLINACLNAYRNAYQNTNNAPKMTHPVTVRVMGFNSCFGDTLYQSSDPDQNTPYNVEDNPINFTQ
jgi:hypothetical protein